MIGLDTNILVAHAIPEHPAHGHVRKRIDRFLLDGHHLGVTSGILAEFIHVVTDPRRFENPLTMPEALEWATFWSDAEEVVIISPDITAHRKWLDWLEQHRVLSKHRLPHPSRHGGPAGL